MTFVSERECPKWSQSIFSVVSHIQLIVRVLQLIFMVLQLILKWSQVILSKDKTSGMSLYIFSTAQELSGLLITSSLHES